MVTYSGMETKMYECEYCGKKGMKSPMEKAHHVRYCEAAKKAKDKQKRKTAKVSKAKISLKGPKPKKNGRPKKKRTICSSQNIQYVPMIIALNFSDQTFDILGGQQVEL
jgi:hypothetical protein